jgi:hypothetical protein
MMLAVDLSYIAFTILRYFPSFPSFLTDFVMEWCWILLKSFSASIEIMKWFLSLHLLMCYITFIDLRMLNHPCISGMKPIWSWCMVFLMCYWIRFAIILLRIFALMFIKEIGLKFSFLEVSYKLF